MKLSDLFEEDGESIEDIFNAGEMKSYVSAATFDVRSLKDGERVSIGKKEVVADAGQYLIRPHGDLGGDKVVDAEEINASLAPVRPSQKPDAEGFVLYKSIEEVEAVQFSGKRTTFKDDWGKTVTLLNNDFLVRDINTPESFFVLRPAEFTKKYQEK